MQARMPHPAFLLPGAFDALSSLSQIPRSSHLPESVLELVDLRASQINGCGVCIAGACTVARRQGETDERLNAIVGWRHAPYFSPSERAALALAESMTRLSDRSDPVPDDVWEECTRHFDEQALAALVLQIAVINTWNRLNIATAQVVGEWQP